MSKLTNIEKYAIQGLLSAGVVEIEVLAKTIKKPIPVVQKYVESLVKTVEKLEENKVEVAEETKKAVNNTRGKDLMVTTTMQKKNKGVAMMTGESSGYADSVRDQVASRSRTSKGAIYNIKEDRIE